MSTGAERGRQGQELWAPSPRSPRSLGRPRGPLGQGPGQGAIGEPGRALPALAERPRQLCPGAGIPRVAGLQAGPGSELGRGGVVLPAAALCVSTLTPRIRTLFHFPFPLLSQLCALGTPEHGLGGGGKAPGSGDGVEVTSLALFFRSALVALTPPPPQGHRVVVRALTLASTPIP